MRRRRHAPLLCFCLRAVATRRKLVLLPVVARRARSRNAGAPRSPVRNILLILFKDLGTRPSIDHHMLIIPSRYNEWVSVGTGHAGAAVHAHMEYTSSSPASVETSARCSRTFTNARTRVNHATPNIAIAASHARACARATYEVTECRMQNAFVLRSTNEVTIPVRRPARSSCASARCR